MNVRSVGGQYEPGPRASDYPGLLRAADLIGQLADVKTPALFAEFCETGFNEKLGFRNPQDLRSAYPSFSGRRSDRISETLWNICALPRKVSCGLPTFMLTCSQRNTATRSELVEGSPSTKFDLV